VVHVAARALGIEAPKELPRSDEPRSAGSHAPVIASSATWPTRESPAPEASARPAVEPDSIEQKAPTVLSSRKAKWDGGAPRSSPPASEGSIATSGAPGASPAPPEDEGTLALYRKARKLHFVDQNPGAALAAWDEYLAAEPKGPLAVDARYDRALCLVRLGRKTEARAALQPFAQGTYGSYRQDEAKRLLEALH